MVIRIRDTETRKILGTFSDFISLIWTERFKTYGDFELVVPLTKKIFDLLKIDRYIEVSTSSNLMIIENIYVQYDDNDSKMTVKGRSFESILDRRIIYNWRNTEENTTLSVLLNELINSNILLHSINERQIDWIDLDINVPEEIDGQIFQTSINRGDNLGDSIYTLGNQFGFCPITVFNQSNKRITINIYFGENKNIIFKRANHNITKSSYTLSVDNFKTSAIIAGSGEGTKRMMVTVSRISTESITNQEDIIYEYNGVTRREIFVDARDLQKNNETNEQYKKRLKERGIEKLKENNKDYVVDGMIINIGKHVLNTDYILGDIVKIESDFYSASARITEIIQSWSDTGYEIYPSFDVIDIFTGDISESYNIS